MRPENHTGLMALPISSGADRRPHPKRRRPVVFDGNEKSRQLGSQDALFTTEIVVPADLVARSRPSGHSVPITRMRQKVRRVHPYRNLINALLLTLVLLFVMSLAIYLIDAMRAARYYLLYWLVGVGGLMAVVVFIRFAFRRGLEVKADNGVNLAEGGSIDSSYSSHDGGH
jgi:hypothetical protein